MRKRILEIGPSIRPMHHRTEGRDGSLVISDGEEYVGLELPHEVDRIMEHEVWQKAREEYGDRALLIKGDRADMSNIPDASVDELVALGTHGGGREEKIFSEFVRVLSPNCVLCLGNTEHGFDALMDKWRSKLGQLGFKEVDRQNYDYFPDVKSGRKYVVVSFKRETKEN